MAIAAVAVPAAGASLPTPPSTSDPSNFDVRADSFFTALPGLQTSENALAANVYLNAQGVYDNTVEVANNTSSVAVNTALAASYAGATVWTIGTYAVDTIKYSPIDRRLYRCIVATTGADTTDPKNDTTKWAVVSPAQAALLISGLVQQAIAGSTYAFSNVAAQSAATNLLLQSKQFNTSWTTSGASVSPDFTMAPSATTGELTADKLVEAATTAIHCVYQAVTTAANQPYTLSLMVKAAGRTNVALRLDKDSLNADYVQATYNLTTGATSSVGNTGTASGAAATATYVGDGWWLCGLSGTPASTAGTTVRCQILIDQTGSYTGDGVKGIYASQAQLETGSVYSSRIDTTTTSATRAAAVIAPSRLVLPASPAADAFVRVFVANGIDTNVIDPNGQTFMGQAGPCQIDNNLPQSIGMQFVNGSWRIL